MEIQKPLRARHAYTQTLNAPPATVFPLLCPVRECEWVAGWDPGVVLSESGIAELDCVFTTGEGDERATWIVTRYRPPLEIAFAKFTPGRTAGNIVIELTGDGDGTRAHIAYSIVSLGPAGDGIVRDFTEEYFRGFMQTWEEELNQFLAAAETR